MSDKPAVTITGMGCICGPGNTLAECMDNLFRERKNPAPPQRFSSNHNTSYPAFEVAGDLTSFTPRLKADITRTGRLALAAAHEAVADAGLDPELLRNRRVGVCMGTTVGTTMNNEWYYREYLKGEDPPMSHIDRFLNSNPASVVAREYDIAGPCQTVCNACSSGTDAIGLGAFWIESGICDIVLAGGSDELSHVTYNGFISLMITDDGPCKPFDATRKGLNLGEGAAILVLESEASQQKRKARSRGYFLGYGASCDAYHLTAPHPEGRGLKKSIEGAMRHGGLSADNIAFVNAHGTATPDNDKAESRVLNDMLPGVPFLSTKGHTGHTLGAAGAIEAAFTVACLEMGKIPANAGFSTPDPELPATPVAGETPIKGAAALSESLAFGGHNAVIAVGLERRAS